MWAGAGATAAAGWPRIAGALPCCFRAGRGYKRQMAAAAVESVGRAECGGRLPAGLWLSSWRQAVAPGGGASCRARHHAVTLAVMLALLRT